MKKFIDYITGSTKEQRSRDAACATFQIQEHDGSLWFTYQGNLFCPCEMFKDSPVEALKTIRNLYMERLN